MARNAAPDRAEANGIGALEAVDGLLLVAHREQGAKRVACPFAREELLGQALDDRPLLGVGVLRLVHEDVVDAAVDLEQHPGRGAGAGQEHIRLEDQVVIVEHRLALLGAVILGLDRVGEQKHRRARLGASKLRALGREPVEAALGDIESGAKPRLRLPQRLAAHGSARRVLVCEKNRPQRGDPCRAARSPCSLQAVSQLLVRAGLRPVDFERGEQRVDVAVREHIGKLRGQLSLAHLLAKPEQALEAALLAPGPVWVTLMQGHHAGKVAAPAEHRVDDLAEIILDRHRHDLGKRLSQWAVAICCGTRHDGIERSALEPHRLSLIKDGEMRRHLGLEREALQQPLAEAVDGVDLEAAFGFQRLRKQPPRRLGLGIARRAAEKARKPFTQCAVFHRGPRSQLLEQPVLHLCRRHLGVGQAEDALRL